MCFCKTKYIDNSSRKTNQKWFLICWYLFLFYTLLQISDFFYSSPVICLLVITELLLFPIMYNDTYEFDESYQHNLGDTHFIFDHIHTFAIYFLVNIYPIEIVVLADFVFYFFMDLPLETEKIQTVNGNIVSYYTQNIYYPSLGRYIPEQKRSERPATWSRCRYAYVSFLNIRNIPYIILKILMIQPIFLSLYHLCSIILFLPKNIHWTYGFKIHTYLSTIAIKFILSIPSIDVKNINDSNRQQIDVFRNCINSMDFIGYIKELFGVTTLCVGHEN